MINVARTKLSPLFAQAGSGWQRLRGFFADRPWLTRPLLAFLITRLVIFAAAYMAEIAIPGQTGAGLWHTAPNNVFLDVWARWDSGFYMRIATDGYAFQPGLQSSVAFFPLYPMLMNLLIPFTGSELLAGFIVSNTCLLGALIVLYLLTEYEFKDAETASRTVFYIAAFPTAFFFTAVYTESTYLLFSVLTIYLARRRLWHWATVAGILCAASRIVGFVVWGVVMLEWMQSHGWTFKGIFRRDTWINLFRGLFKEWLVVLMIAMIPLGIISYMVFLKVEFNDPIAFWTTQAAWGRKATGPLVQIAQRTAGLLNADWAKGQMEWRDLLNLVSLLGGLVFSGVIWRKLGASYAIFTIVSVLIPASSGLGSLMRYVLVVFPVFMMLGHYGRRPWVDRALIIGFSILLGILTTVFVNWLFVA